MATTPKKGFRLFFSTVKQAGVKFSDDNVTKLSAALSYYTVFSIPSLLFVIIGLAGIFFGKEVVEGEVFNQIGKLIGYQAATQVQEMLKGVSIKHNNVIATVVGIITLLGSASGIFGEMQDSMNTIWGLKTKPNRGLIKMLLSRLASYSMVLILGFILLVSLVLNALISTFFNRLLDYFSGDFVVLLYIANNLLSFLVVTTLFAFIFKTLPDAKVWWRDVFTGAIVTALLFIAGKFLIGYYLQHFAGLSAYGAVGSLLVILLWVYYSAIILYFGAEFTLAYACLKGRKIEPSSYAVMVEEKIIDPSAKNKRTNPDDKQTPYPETDKVSHS